MNDKLAHIKCACGQMIQIENDNCDDWDENATANSYILHKQTCPSAGYVPPPQQPK